MHDKIPATLICDDMVAAALKKKQITAVVVGADRVAANGDTANKIGTYQVKARGVSKLINNDAIAVCIAFTHA